MEITGKTVGPFVFIGLLVAFSATLASADPAQVAEVVKKPAPTAVSALNRGAGGVVARASNPAPEEQGVPGAPERVPEFVAAGEILEVPEGTPMIEWPPRDLRDLRACGPVEYSNMNWPAGTHYYLSFPWGGIVADDATLITGPRGLCEIQLMTYKPSGATYSITVWVYNDCPPSCGGTGVMLVGALTQTGIPAGAAVTLTFPVSYITITDTVWIEVYSDDSEAGWLLNGGCTQPDDVGFTDETFGVMSNACDWHRWPPPPPPQVWHCDCWFQEADPEASLYAGFAAALRCSYAEAGACCDNATGHCVDGVLPSACTGANQRFAPLTLCANLQPPCGKGACCLPATDANCNDPLDPCCQNLYNTTTNGQCTAVSGTWHAGEVCTLSPTALTGIHCPPHHDDCANADLKSGALPLTFTGRNDGATRDCLDPEAWIAFTTTQCWDIVLSFCGTDPPFGSVYTLLYPSCCDIGLYRSRTSVTWSSREGDCCKNDPPGYALNATMTFDNLPAGTWYYPVYSSVPGQASGEYTITVDGAPCHQCGDYNANGVTDWSDYASFQGCLAGPTTAVSPPCDFFDFDDDTHVDLYDFWWFQQCFGTCVTCPEYSDPCAECGPGPHWIDTPPCLPGQDQMPSSALVGIDTDLDCVADTSLILSGPVAVKRRTGPIDDSTNFPGLRPVDGHLDVIDTEIITMSLTGGGVILTAGAGQGAIPLAASLGVIAEQTSNPALADSFFDVFFEVELYGGQRAYNQTPLRIDSVINCVPPDATYIHPVGCIPLYDSPMGGTLIANLVTANHDTYPISDLCANANLVACNSTFVTNNTNATDDPNDPVLSCIRAFGTKGSHTMWYKFVATDTSVRIQTCNNNDPTASDTVIALFSGTCSSLTELACGEDGCGSQPPYLLSKICYGPLTVGQTYYIEVATSTGGAPGEIRLDIECPCPDWVPPTTYCYSSCPPGGKVEGEPNCYNEYRDWYDSGCNAIACTTGADCQNGVCVGGVCTGVDPLNPPTIDMTTNGFGCGAVWCGKSGRFTVAAANRRDTDWYEITIGEWYNMTWSVYAQFPQSSGLVETDPVGSADCADNTGYINPGDTLATAGCLETSVEVNAGTYRWYVAPNSTSGPVACTGPNNDYFATLWCTRGSTLPTPGNTCATAAIIPAAGGTWSGALDPAYGWTWSGAGGGCVLGEGPFCPAPCAYWDPWPASGEVDVWWRYTAPCTGMVTFQTCGYDALGNATQPTNVSTVLAVWEGTCAQFTTPSYPPTVCGGGATQPTNCCPDLTPVRGAFTMDVVAGNDYYIQVMTAALSNQYGIVTLDVSECVAGCANEACCRGSYCTMELPEDCVATGGHNKGPGSTCSPTNPCP